MATVIGDLGNGTGFIYVTIADGVTLVTNFRNDSMGYEAVRALANSKASRTSSTSQYDASFMLSGNRFFFSSNAGATEGAIFADNIEITRFLIGRNAVTPNYTTATTIAAGVATITRVASEMFSTIDTEGAAATDDLDTITIDDVVNGDRLVFSGANAARIVTFQHATGNIFLATNTDFATNGTQSKITLQYQSVAPAGWYEVSRAAVFPTVAALRDQSIAQGVSGVTSTALNNGGGTITLVPGTDTIVQELTGAGLVLVAPWTVTFGGTPINGDQFIINYRASADLNGQTIGLGGAFITTVQADKGLTQAISSYDGAAWNTVLVQLSNTTDFVDTTDLATKEGDLGTPASDGMILSSTTADVRSWIAVPNSILYNTTANNGTTAIITEENLKTYTLPAGTMDTDGDVLYCKTIYQTAANANAKTETFYFGTTAVATITGNFNAQTVIIEGTVTRVDATNQRASFKATSYDTATGAWGSENAFYTSPTENLAVDVDIIAASTNGVAAANDSINRTMFVQKMDK